LGGHADDMKNLVLIFSLFALPVSACPVIVDVTGEKDAMLERLAAATDYSTSRRAADAVWAYWQTAPDAQAQEWLDEGLALIRYADYEKAKLVLGSLVEYCPAYGEGYNQLAFAQYLAQEYDASAGSLRQAMALEPQHFGAIAGMGLIAHKRGNLGAAKIWIKRALKVHPFLNERVILDIPEKTDEL
jgi:tetratricopeptide (TPR) repeat protein